MAMWKKLVNNCALRCVHAKGPFYQWIGLPQ